MIPYSKKIDANDFRKIEQHDGKVIVEEFRQLQQVLETTKADLDALKTRRTFFVPAHHGDPSNIINTNNKIIPTAFGGAGMFLERFSNVNRECFTIDGKITGLKLYAAVTMASLAANETVNFKVAFKFGGATTTRFGPVHTISGAGSATVRLFTDCIDIFSLVGEFISGDFFMGIAAWVTGGPASNRVLIGASQSNPNPYTALIVETER